MSRRTLHDLTAASTAVLALGAAAQTASARPGKHGRTLRALAERADLRIGTAVDTTALTSGVSYRTLAAGEFGPVTAYAALVAELRTAVRAKR